MEISRLMNKLYYRSYHNILTSYVYVALRGTPGAPGVPLPRCSCLSTAVLGNFGLGAHQMQHVQSALSYLPMLHRKKVL